MKPLAFKVRTQGTYNGAKGGKVKAGFGGAGALWYEDKTFTIAAVQDQWLLAPTLSLSLSHPKPPMTQQPIPRIPLRFLSVCSGIEAASVAWEPLGWKAVGFSEIEPFPCAVLAHRFPNTPNYGSLTEYASWPIEPNSIDLLVGGTPCQSFSVAGLRKGMADPRGNLALVFLGLADRVKPRWIVWENVPGVLSSNGGRDFGSFLGALEQLGYGWAYRVLDAQHFGVPQRRRRVFVVACLGAGGWESAAKVLFEPESLSGDTAKGRKKGQGVASDAQGGAGASGLPNTVGTLCADTHPGAYSGQDAYTGRLIPCPDNDIVQTLCARDSKGVGNQYVQEGKCIPCSTIPFRKSKRAQSTTDDESWVEAGEANTLNNFDLGDTRTTHAVVNSVAPTVISSGPPCSLTGNERVDADALAITVNIYGGNKRKDRPEGGMYVRSEETSKCLDAANGLNPTCSQGGTAIVTPMAVRRLTPTECMRLQGFPDDWARIPWKGKPADQCPDGPQYKAAGNSMAVPVMRHIGTRIAMLEAGQL